MSERVFVVVPVLNEAPNVPALVDGFRLLQERLGRERSLAFVVVDDGSSDGTASALRAACAGLTLEVLEHEANRGPGVAFGTAFEHLAPQLGPHDWVVTMEGDNTSRFELIEHMLRRTLEGYDVILASPYMFGGGVVHTSAWRVFVSHLGNAFVKEFLGIHGILTMSSFFRLYRGSVILDLQTLYGARIVERRGFESMVELLLKMIYAGVSISEVPMVLDTSRRRGRSKMKLGRTARGYVTLWWLKRRWKNEAATRAAAGGAAGTQADV